VVSLLKGWYLFFWPLLAIACLAVGAAGGLILTIYSSQFWH
jgi:hypothetical protein